MAEENQNFCNIKELQAHLSSPPDERLVMLNDITQTLYIPIGAVEDMLDTTFGLDWSTQDFKWTIKDNKVIGSIVLMVVSCGICISRQGAAARNIVPETYDTADGAITLDIETVLPALKSECIKNAAKSLGTRFGRDLNRSTDDVETFAAVKMPTVNDVYEQAIKDVLAFDTKEALQGAARLIIKKYEKQLSASELGSLNTFISKTVKEWI